MQMPSTLLDESLNGVARANEICEEVQAIEEERARADNDAAFELACRIIVMKSLPAWIDEICAEQCRQLNLLSSRPGYGGSRVWPRSGSLGGHAA
jgi:hypothetical protein